MPEQKKQHGFSFVCKAHELHDKIAEAWHASKMVK